MEERRILSPAQMALQEEVLESLSDLIGRGEAILLVGSGCSRPMFPSWGELVDDLAAMADGCIPGGYTLPEHAEDELERLQHIVEAVGSHQEGERCFERLQQRLIQLFHMNTSGPTPLHEVLVSLPFRGLLTTNYDRLLERALGPYDGDRAIDAQADAPLLVSRGVRAVADPGRSETVIHLHGTGNRPQEMVLTVEDYKQANGLADASMGGGRNFRRPYARNLLSALLMTRRVVFVGFGLRDPFLMRVLRDVTADWWEWDSPIHYAIMPIDEVDAADQWDSAARYRTEYGIEILFYEVRNGDHRRLTATFEEIAGRLGVRRAVPAEKGVASRAQPEEPRQLPGAKVERAEPEAGFETLMEDRIRRNLRGVEEDSHED